MLVNVLPTECITHELPSNGWTFKHILSFKEKWASLHADAYLFLSTHCKISRPAPPWGLWAFQWPPALWVVSYRKNPVSNTMYFWITRLSKILLTNEIKKINEMTQQPSLFCRRSNRLFPAGNKTAVRSGIFPFEITSYNIMKVNAFYDACFI